ncbi:hypothetical protein L6452_20403 [Arctium lappa]|uniref:Uncharacterized protein n=1 Tax=Arctium lappa TaxID=4217 RepID=A0ACB9BBQ4_ARCLA|nr:hypothetical protein L6452_20403 [Arctium lappa]
MEIIVVSGKNLKAPFHFEVFASGRKQDLLIGKGSFNVNPSVLKVLKSGSPIFYAIEILNHPDRPVGEIHISAGRHEEEEEEDYRDFKAARYKRKKTLVCGSCQKKVSSSTMDSHRCKA